MADNTGMAEHRASVTVDAPVHQVYGMFTHFNDFPKFMSFVKEVTYYDDQRSHWVAEVVGRHEWDAVNENWVEDQQVGWRSTAGLENFGKVTFQPMNTNQTRVDVYVNYNPPAGVLGDIGENLGAGGRFDSVLQHDLDNFARMIQQAPPGALDPTSSNYLFHSGSAAAKGRTTQRQNDTMGDQDNYPQGNYPQGSYQQGNYPQSDYQQGSSQQSSYSSSPGTTYSAGTGGDYMQDPNSAYSSATAGDTGYTSGTSTDYTSGTSNTDYTTNRPVTDQDIIRGTTPQDRETMTPMPPSTGVSNPVIPPDNDVAKPIMPPDRDTDY